ncbi:hypothetical protein M885DRAFT_522353 [Pelagophyceae sp. CCMP2097]|nr:hypothetical protein M885DRAFT_522353 [Pelagophyceae sp. CCMP2097]
MDDWNAVAMAEESCVAAGDAKGFTVGDERGAKESYDFGALKGHEVGSELGFYIGCCAAWRKLAEARRRPLSTRALKAMADFEAGIANSRKGGAHEAADYVDVARRDFRQLTQLVGAVALARQAPIATAHDAEQLSF